ncbi:unnamed protein product [Didymodactylos carnosus]|uniref:Uncharacterized protein n=1 Tax=Didymodactylos carnosus TaxID=1234261 RepID=A0A8S2QU16_9BILA|nr:unnamed protein product [Didymodactylos carnosus]CAF4125405.1 unnamed protein product [Didymodactylos carnosus]
MGPSQPLARRNRHAVRHGLQMFSFFLRILFPLIDVLYENQLQQQKIKTFCEHLIHLLRIIPYLTRITIYHITMPVDHYERSLLTDLFTELAPTPRRFCSLTGITTTAFCDIYPVFV